MSDKIYSGLDNDDHGGMTPIGNIIKDAWLFDILPMDEKCEGWSHTRIQSIYEQTKSEWDKYGLLVSNLPEELREKHAKIHSEALKRARELGWDPEIKDES